MLFKSLYPLDVYFLNHAPFFYHSSQRVERRNRLFVLQNIYFCIIASSVPQKLVTSNHTPSELATGDQSLLFLPTQRNYVRFTNEKHSACINTPEVIGALYKYLHRLVGIVASAPAIHFQFLLNPGNVCIVRSTHSVLFYCPKLSLDGSCVTYTS